MTYAVQLECEYAIVCYCRQYLIFTSVVTHNVHRQERLASRLGATGVRRLHA